MGDPRIFTFSPPLLTSDIESARTQVMATIPPYEIEKREYFEGMLNSLVEYALGKDHQKHNFSLNIAHFDPHHIDEHKIWSEHNIWVKLRVTGGYGDAFRSRYMATHIGVARVDWKRKTLRILKTTSVHAATTAVSIALDQAHLSNPLTEKGLDYVGDKAIEKIEEGQKHRSSERLHQLSYSPEDMFKQLNGLTEADLNKIRGNGQINELARHMFAALDSDHSGTLEHDEFLKFWHTLLHQNIHEAMHHYEEIAGSAKGINLQQFTSLFVTVLERLTAVREDARHHQISNKMSEAKSLVVEFYKLPAATARHILASEEDFTQLAHKVFSDLDELHSGTIDKQEFLKFFSSALEMSVHTANQAFQAVAGTSKVINFPHFATYFRQLIGEHLGSGSNTLAWTRFVNHWMTMTPEELIPLQTDREAAGIVAGKLFEVVGAGEHGLTYEQFKVLEAGLDRALYETPETEEEQIIRFQSHATQSAAGTLVISKEKYIDLILIEMENVTEFKKDWDFARIFDDAIFRLGDEVDHTTLVKLYNRYYSRYAPNDTISYLQYARLARCVHNINMSGVFNLKRDIVLNFGKVVQLNIETVTKTKHENAQFPGKHYFIALAKLPLQNLTELVLEDYRLHATAHLVFLTVHPYRPQHDHTTFMLYGQHLCAEFHLQEEMVTEWFHLFAKNQLLSEDGLVLCLKQAINKLISS